MTDERAKRLRELLDDVGFVGSAVIDRRFLEPLTELLDERAQHRRALDAIAKVTCSDTCTCCQADANVARKALEGTE